METHNAHQLHNTVGLLAPLCGILTLCWGVGDETCSVKGAHAKASHPYPSLVCPEQDLCTSLP